MLSVVLFAFVAGILTILSPCILPVVPLVAGTASSGGGRRLAGIVLGFAATFVAVTVLLASTLAAAGVTTDRLRLASALLLGLFGATIAIPRLRHWVEARLAVLANLGGRLAGQTVRPGFATGIILGASIGLIWAPCVGPIMAAVIAAAITTGPSADAAIVAFAYAAGAAIPLAVIGQAGRRAVERLGEPRHRAKATQGLGALTLVAAVLVVTGLDVPVETAFANALPAGWADALIAVERQPGPVGDPGVVDRRSATAIPSGEASLPSPIAQSPQAAVALEDLGPAPELAGITAWINSEPTTLASLRGKVVLIHFWTFGCINCIHVQPYVKAWYERYADAGLVVIGVHTPELSFERDLANVRDAVAHDGVLFPVAFDPAFATWHAYRNSYWPAFYFIDRDGRIRHVHFGEGDYDGSEQVIRELLADRG